MTTDPTDPLHRFGEVRRELEARWPESQISPTLDRIRTLTQFLGDPQRAYPVIHVTGTNGKTSTARMIESLLRAFGLHTGLITSPHLSDLRERIRLDGEPISIDAFLDIYDEVAPVLAMADEASELEGGPRLSFFEVMTGLAFAAFADAPGRRGRRRGRHGRHVGRDQRGRRSGRGDHADRHGPLGLPR